MKRDSRVAGADKEAPAGGRQTDRGAVHLKRANALTIDSSWRELGPARNDAPT